MSQPLNTPAARKRALIAITIPLIIGLVLAATMIPRRAQVDAEHRRPVGGV